MRGDFAVVTACMMCTFALPSVCVVLVAGVYVANAADLSVVVIVNCEGKRSIEAILPTPPTVQSLRLRHRRFEMSCVVQELRCTAIGIFHHHP